MITFITVVHIVVCVFLIIVVLLQHGKGADMGATFGGGSQTVFGPRGAATILSKVTAAAAILFMTTSISLAWLSARTSSKPIFAKEPEAEGEAKAGAGTEKKEASSQEEAMPEAKGDKNQESPAGSSTPEETKKKAPETPEKK